jgi:long-chain acyl-CoA synthetase
MPVYEGYGLTEGSPLVTLNHPGKGNYYIGSVGPTVKDVEVKIAPDGEILVKGPNVMKGYFKQDKLNKETIVDGWLYTGDIGSFVQDKFLLITGRKKQMFKTSYGKYIVPQAIENKFSESPVVDYIVVIGEGKHCAGAVISPNFEYLRNKVSIDKKLSNQKLIELPGVKKIIQKEVELVNRQLGRTEQIKKYLIVPDVWTPESGEISPTMKIKRNIIQKKYNRKIHILYKEDSI